MKYTMSIQGKDGEKITITEETVIRKIDIRVFQNDKSSNDRSEQLFAELTVRGVLNDISQKETREIFEWSKKTDKNNVYKTVSVQVYDQEELIRDYYMKDMYCASYRETFNECWENDAQGGDSLGSFVLELKQRVGAIETIVVEC